MELIPLIHSSHKLTLDNKTKICNILDRYPIEMHNSLVLELIDCISVGEFELINHEEYEELKDAVKNLKEDHLDQYDIKSIAEEVATKVLDVSLSEFKELAITYKNMNLFKEESHKLQKYVFEINENLQNLRESILKLAKFIDTKKSVNLRTENKKPDLLLEDINKIIDRITPIILRK